MKKTRKVLFLILALAIILPRLAVASPNSRIKEKKVLRLSGNNRSETSIKVSQEAYKEGSDIAVISGYHGSPDALTGTLFVHSEGGPLLVASNRGLTKELKDEVLRLGAKQIYILGGENVVDRQVESELKELGIRVARIEGLNRWETSAEIAKKAENTNRVFLVLGRKLLKNGQEDALADALAIGPVSAKEGKPILLTEKDRIPTPTKNAIKDLKVRNVTIVGGELAIYPKIENELKQMGINVDRIQGENRWETAKEIAVKHFKSSEYAIVANDRRDTDALVGGYLAAKQDAPILLTQVDRLSDVTGYHIKDNMKYVYVLGGERVITSKVFSRIMNKVFKISEANAEFPIKIETPDLSGQSTHPDVLYIEEGWNGHKYWMAHTPYKDSNEKVENPCLSYSDDGINFKTLEGATNPIDSPRQGLNPAGHMSDTDMILKDGRMEIYYRYRYRPEGERIYRKTSSDGINWSDRQLVMEVHSRRGDDLLSPSLIYEEGLYKMWWVGHNATIYVSTSKDGLIGTWTKKKKVDLNFAGKELRPWHLEVFKDNGKHYLLLNSYDGMKLTKGRKLAIGESTDKGLSFNKIQTILKIDENSWDNRDIYRGSIIKANDVYKLYYSAMNLDRSWGIGLAESTSLRFWQGVH